MVLKIDVTQKAVLSFVGGFVDTATYVAVVGLFSAHVTGNFVLFASSLSKGFEASDFLKLAVFPVFIVGVVLSASVYSKWKEKDEVKAGEKLLRLVTFMLFVCTALSFFILPAAKSEDSSVSISEGILSMLVVLSMAGLNSHEQFVNKKLGMATVMTGNVTKATIESVQYYIAKKQKKDSSEEHGDTAKYTLILIISFFVGCLSSAFASLHWGLASLIIPTTILTLDSFLKIKRGHEDLYLHLHAK